MSVDDETLSAARTFSISFIFTKLNNTILKVGHRASVKHTDGRVYLMPNEASIVVRCENVKYCI